MNEYKIRVENNYHGVQAIMVEIYDKEYNCYSMVKAYPIENFAKNNRLAQIFLNNLYDLFADKNSKVEIEVVDTEE